VLTRMTRSSMLEILGEDYIRTARSKGLSERMVIYKHAFRNAIVPVITIIGLQTGTFSPARLSSRMFSPPRVGRWFSRPSASGISPLFRGWFYLLPR